MKTIIDPVDKSTLVSELTPERLLRPSNKGGNEVYVVTASEAPSVMREIGRLREIAFRDGGGGTGLACDIDSFDLMEPPCRQLLVWDPRDREILGGYRFLLGEDVKRDEQGRLRMATSHMFGFSTQFINDYLPNIIELGRSFVRLEYQSSKAGAKALYVLDNLWDGLGALTVKYPQIKYLFGKVTMYPGYGPENRNLLSIFCRNISPTLTGWFGLLNRLTPAWTPPRWRSFSPEQTSKRICASCTACYANGAPRYLPLSTPT